jgi:hypothetical protein
MQTSKSEQILFHNKAQNTEIKHTRGKYFGGLESYLGLKNMKSINKQNKIGATTKLSLILSFSKVS